MLLLLLLLIRRRLMSISRPASFHANRHHLATIRVVPGLRRRRPVSHPIRVAIRGVRSRSTAARIRTRIRAVIRPVIRCAVHVCSCHGGGRSSRRCCHLLLLLLFETAYLAQQCIRVRIEETSILHTHFCSRLVLNSMFSIFFLFFSFSFLLYCCRCFFTLLLMTTLLLHYITFFILFLVIFDFSNLSLMIIIY